MGEATVTRVEVLHVNSLFNVSMVFEQIRQSVFFGNVTNDGSKRLKFGIHWRDLSVVRALVSTQR